MCVMSQPLREDCLQSIAGFSNANVMADRILAFFGWPFPDLFHIHCSKIIQMHCIIMDILTELTPKKPKRKTNFRCSSTLKWSQMVKDTKEILLSY